MLAVHYDCGITYQNHSQVASSVLAQSMRRYVSTCAIDGYLRHEKNARVTVRSVVFFEHGFESSERRVLYMSKRLSLLLAAQVRRPSPNVKETRMPLTARAATTGIQLLAPRAAMGYSPHMQNGPITIPTGTQAARQLTAPDRAVIRNISVCAGYQV